jgi:hypothetical protein
VALAAERNAGYMVTEFAQKVTDPVLREALAMQGVEETRHANLLDVMLRHYEIAVADLGIAPQPATERSFLDFGYEECIDSFFGFGIFGLARQIQLFVPELTDIFEVVLLEEARHVTFFVNWIARLRARRQPHRDDVRSGREQRRNEDAGRRLRRRRRVCDVRRRNVALVPAIVRRRQRSLYGRHAPVTAQTFVPLDACEDCDRFARPVIRTEARAPIFGQTAAGHRRLSFSRGGEDDYGRIAAETAQFFGGEREHVIRFGERSEVGQAIAVREHDGGQRPADVSECRRRFEELRKRRAHAPHGRRTDDCAP